MGIADESASLSLHERPLSRHRRGENEAVFGTLAALDEATREAAKPIGLSVEDTEDAVGEARLMYFVVRRAAAAAGNADGADTLSEEQNRALARAATAELGRARRRRRGKEVEWVCVCGVDGRATFDPADPRPSPQDTVEHQAMVDAIKGVLSEMPEAMGALIRARFVEGVTYAALASECGCSANALRMRLRRELDGAGARLKRRGWDIG